MHQKYAGPPFFCMQVYTSEKLLIHNMENGFIKEKSDHVTLHSKWSQFFMVPRKSQNLQYFMASS